MGMSAGPSKGVKSEINVTPLVDVVLVLLIIFMVVTPMLQNGKAVNLPKSHFKEEKKNADLLILSITPDKSMYMESDKYDDEHLEKALQHKLEEKPDRHVMLKGDDSLVFADVRKVMNIARKAGAKGISLGIEEIKK